MLETLTDFHEHMLGVICAAERHLLADYPVITELNALRTRMSRLITTYQLFVHREVFEPIIAYGSTAEARHARSMKAECIILAEDFRAHTKRWSLLDVEAEWAEYQPAALQFIARNRNQIRNVSELAANLQALAASQTVLGNAAAA